MRIFDDDDNELPRGIQGEIVIRPKRPHVMFEGYWGRPEATVETAATGGTTPATSAGSTTTDYLFFVDRKADYLRRRGENICQLRGRAHLDAPRRRSPTSPCTPSQSQLTEDDLKVTASCKQGAALTEEELFRWCVERAPVLRAARATSSSVRSCRAARSAGC